MEQKQLSLENMNKEIVVLKEQMKQMRKSIEEDLRFVIRTELAWQEIDSGKGIRTSVEDFFKDLKKA